MKINISVKKFILEGDTLSVDVTHSDSVHIAKREIVFSYDRENTETALLEKHPESVSNRNRFIHSFFSLSSSVDFFIRITENKMEEERITDSEKITVIPAEYPYISSLKMRLVYPKYTEIPDERFENNGNIAAVGGTACYINGEANNELRSGKLIFFSGENKRKKRTVKSIRVNGKKFSGSFKVNKSGSYNIELTDRSGIKNQPIKYDIIVLNDNLPDIKLEEPGMDIKMPDHMRPLLRINATDDFGISKLWLDYKILSKYDYPKTNRIELNTEYLPNIIVQFNWNLENLNLIPGDMILYSAVCNDSYPYKDH
ncbi:MAG: hypothetical protein KAS39_03250, partial [Actinomycetia bacterium]|nr:hypothetical protein [Actinomycetes bacterium]